VRRRGERDRRDEEAEQNGHDGNAAHPYMEPRIDRDQQSKPAGGLARLLRMYRTLLAIALALPAPTGTAPQSGPPSGTGQPILTGIRTGRHPGYDRTVFDFTGGTPGWRAEYGTLYEQGRGDPVPVPGAATLVVTFNAAGPPAIDPSLPGLPRVRYGGYFEGHAGFGIGVTGHNGFRVLVLHHPDRIAVDVAHRAAPACG